MATRFNTVGQSNGEIQVWVDDQEALFLNDIRFRTVDNVQVDRFYFSTFYGGNTPDWGPLKDESIYFDDFRIYTDPADAGISRFFKIPGIFIKNALDKIYIKVSDALITGVEVWNIEGNQVKVFGCQGKSSCRFSVGKMENGIYILKVTTPEGCENRRFVIMQ
jgi:hypothetical protein